MGGNPNDDDIVVLRLDNGQLAVDNAKPADDADDDAGAVSRLSAHAVNKVQLLLIFADDDTAAATAAADTTG